jgi:NAD(P)H-dependent FMN reductase
MNIIVLNGSPKGKTSITMQYVHLLEKRFREHSFEIVHIAQHIKRIEREEERFAEIVAQVRAADGVLWAFPLYVLLVHGGYKRFIELIRERNVEEAFAGKYTVSLSTSIHFYDHTAHNYIHSICDDLGMRYMGAFSAEMQDLLAQKGQDLLVSFGRRFFSAIERQAPTQLRFAPVVHQKWDYTRSGDSCARSFKPTTVPTSVWGSMTFHNAIGRSRF